VSLEVGSHSTHSVAAAAQGHLSPEPGVVPPPETVRCAHARNTHAPRTKNAKIADQSTGKRVLRTTRSELPAAAAASGAPASGKPGPMIDFSLSPLAGDPAAEDAQRSGQPSTSGAKGASSSQRVIKVETDIEDFEQCMWTSLMPPCPPQGQLAPMPAMPAAASVVAAAAQNTTVGARAIGCDLSKACPRDLGQQCTPCNILQSPEEPETYCPRRANKLAVQKYRQKKKAELEQLRNENGQLKKRVQYLEEQLRLIQLGNELSLVPKAHELEELRKLKEFTNQIRMLVGTLGPPE